MIVECIMYGIMGIVMLLLFPLALVGDVIRFIDWIITKIRKGAGGNEIKKIDWIYHGEDRTVSKRGESIQNQDN